MAKKIIKENVQTEDTAAASTIHPKAGSSSDGSNSSGGGGLGDVKPGRAEMLAKVMGAIAGMDKDSCMKWYNGMISTSKGHFAQDKGDATGNRASIAMHPSDAIGKGVKEAIKQDLNDLLGEEFTDEFKEKATTVFEAALNARVTAELVELEDKYEAALDEACEKIHEEVMTKVETFIEYTAQEWLSENEVAIESALRSEITSEFMEGLRDLFLQHNIAIPEEQVSVVDELAQKVQDLEGRLADAITDNADLRKFRELTQKKATVEAVADGLTLADKEKLMSLAEGVEADTIEDFKKKITTLRESIKPTDKKSNVENLMEHVDENNKALTESGSEKTVNLTAQQKAYHDAINRVFRKPV